MYLSWIINRAFIHVLNQITNMNFNLLSIFKARETQGDIYYGHPSLTNTIYFCFLYYLFLFILFKTGCK